MFWGILVVIALVFWAVYLHRENAEYKQLQTEEVSRIFEQADILSRKIRYENKSLTTRIMQDVDQFFDRYKFITNLILADENGVEHQIPILCATNKGVFLFQLVDYPGKGLFGEHDGEWKIAQSPAMAQIVTNAAALAIEQAMLVKRLTNINVKPITVISKYTPAVAKLTSRDMVYHVIKEEKLCGELKEIVRYGNQTYPDEFMQQVKNKLLSLHIEDEDEDAEDFEPAVDT